MSRKRDVAVVGVCILASIFPDIFVAFGAFPGTISYLAHRTVTHSLVFLPIWSIALATLYWFAVGRRFDLSFVQLVLLCASAITVHIVLDLITPFGTTLFYPISMEAYSVDLWHSFDPFCLAISTAVVVAFVVRWNRRLGWTISLAAIFLAIYMAYGSFALVSRHQAEVEMREYSAGAFPEATYVGTIPRTFWRWKGIVQTDSGAVSVARLSEPRGGDTGGPIDRGNVGSLMRAIRESREMSHRYYLPVSELPLVIREDAEVRKFLRYARFPGVIESGDKLGLVNLIYAPQSYQLSLELDEAGGIVARSVSGFDLFDYGI